MQILMIQSTTISCFCLSIRLRSECYGDISFKFFFVINTCSEIYSEPHLEDISLTATLGDLLKVFYMGVEVTDLKVQ